MMELLEACYDRLQSLEIKPTKANMERLLQTLYDLEKVYKELKKEADSYDRPTADSEGPDSN